MLAAALHGEKWKSLHHLPPPDSPKFGGLFGSRFESNLARARTDINKLRWGCRTAELERTDFRRRCEQVTTVKIR